MLLTCVSFASCGGESSVERAVKNQAQQNPAPAAPAKPVEKGPEIVALNDSTAAAYLLTYGKENPETQIILHTSMGDIKLKLYEDTPLHRANFIRLIKIGFYDNSFFYRVVKDFVIQAGGSKGKRLAIGKYTIPSEMQAKYFHKKGALAMARFDENNPKKSSSIKDFYIVVGHKYTQAQLDLVGQQYKRSFTRQQRNTYTTLGGEATLDNEYTVFGEVTEGMDVVEKIAAVETDSQDWPVNDVSLSIEIVK